MKLFSCVMVMAVAGAAAACGAHAAGAVGNREGGGGAVAAPAPRAFAITGYDGRLFVLLGPAMGAPARDGGAWRQLIPGSYDNTMWAPAPALARPRTVTLVGARGARVVRARDRVYVGRWGEPPMEALEIAIDRDDRREITVALDGDQRDATATIFQGVQTTPAEAAAWAEAKIGPLDDNLAGDGGKAAFVEHIDGSTFDFIYAFHPGGDGHHELLLRRGDDLLARLPDAGAVADLHWHGREYAVVQVPEGLRALDLAAL